MENTAAAMENPESLNIGQLTAGTNGPETSNHTIRVVYESTPTQEAIDGIRFDFASGFRIHYTGKGKKKYHIVMTDADSDLVMFEGDIKAGQAVTGNTKYYIRYSLSLERGGKTVFTHEMSLRGKRVYLMLPQGALGDGLAWLPVAEQFRLRHGAEVTVIMGQWLIDLAGRLYPGITFLPAEQQQRLEGAYAAYFLGMHGKEHETWRPVPPQHLSLQQMAQSILGLPFEVLKCRLPMGTRRVVQEPYVCISTLATNRCKNWNFPGGWTDVVAWLKSLGYRVFDIDRDAALKYGEVIDQMPPNAENMTGHRPILERIAILEHADFFIGLASGLSWLAWELGVPVVQISGFTLPGSEFYTPYRVQNLNFCAGCWNDPSCEFSRTKATWCPRHEGTESEIACTYAVTPKMVKDTILRIPQLQERLVWFQREKERLDAEKKEEQPEEKPARRKKKAGTENSPK